MTANLVLRDTTGSTVYAKRLNASDNLLLMINDYKRRPHDALGDLPQPQYKSKINNYSTFVPSTWPADARVQPKPSVRRFFHALLSMFCDCASTQRPNNSTFDIAL